jgi:hypothetical protein
MRIGLAYLARESAETERYRQEDNHDDRDQGRRDNTQVLADEPMQGRIHFRISSITRINAVSLAGISYGILNTLGTSVKKTLRRRLHDGADTMT